MMDISETVLAKSNQLNADDLMGKTITITVTKVSKSNEPEQPISLNFDGDGGKPYKPCKSMRRVLIHVWGNDGYAYVGRSMTLYRDPEVTYGALKVGGIRISHMSHIDKAMSMALTATRGNKRAYTVQPLAMEVDPPEDKAAAGLDRLIARMEAAPDHQALEAITSDAQVKRAIANWRQRRLDLAERYDTAVQTAIQRLAEGEDDLGGGEMSSFDEGAYDDQVPA